MLMVLHATPYRTTGVSPYFAATGRYLDPGILDTKFPRDTSVGLSQEETETIRQNIIPSKMKTIERTNAKKNRTHLELKPGDKVLVRLGQRKTVESDHYTVFYSW